jgi:2-polyprenyl-6-methoxyphenol hydroxylase-like FAD-dependent oxidoreductase
MDCSAAGMLGDYPPGDFAGFMDYMRRLPVDGIYRTIKDAEPLTEVATTRFPSNRWFRYDQMSRFPDGLIVLADAVGCYNPVYGQGMTIASIHAMILRDMLTWYVENARLDLRGLSVPFQAKVASAVNQAWQVSSGEDYRFPEVEGRRPPGYSMIKWYMDRVHAATSTDPIVYQQFLSVMHMLSPFPTMFRPTFAWRVLRGAKEAFRRDSLRPPPAS